MLSFFHSRWKGITRIIANIFTRGRKCCFCVPSFSFPHFVRSLFLRLASECEGLWERLQSLWEGLCERLSALWNGLWEVSSCEIFSNILNILNILYSDPAFLYSNPAFLYSGYMSSLWKDLSEISSWGEIFSDPAFLSFVVGSSRMCERLPPWWEGLWERLPELILCCLSYSLLSSLFSILTITNTELALYLTVQGKADVLYIGQKVIV